MVRLTSAAHLRRFLPALAAALTIVWFALLAHRPLYDPDEGRYAEIPREMVSGGDWVVPHLNGLVYLEKPPLQYWLTAATFRLLGQSEFTARLWTGLAGFASLGMVFGVAARLWGFRAGLRALGLTAASLLFTALGHQLTLDMLLSTWLLAALACFLMAEAGTAAGGSAARHARRWMLVCWAAMALAVLTKGLIGALVPACVLLLYMIWQRDLRLLRRLHVAWGMPIFLSIAAPWFVLAARANPAFLQFFFVREHFQRFLTSIENRSEPWWFFLPVLIIGILPWLPQALRALMLPWRLRAEPRSFQPTRLLWAWSVFVVVFFSSSNAKLIPYVLPAIPALALLCAAPSAAAGTRRDLIVSALLSFAASVGVLLYASGAWAGIEGRALAAQLAPSLLYTAAALILAGLGCLLLTRQKRLDAALAVLCGGWFLAISTLLVAANGAERFFSAKDIGLVLRREPASAPVFSVQTYEQSLTFYSQRIAILVDYRDEFTLGLAQQPDRGIASLAAFADRWRTLPEGYAIMPYRTRDRLLSLGLPMRELARFPALILMSRR
jgi:4-amino-4-deoxy-L-arabinose transferase-like glycosyltransferase